MVQIFISKDAHDLNEGLQHLHKNGILEAQTLIEFRAVSFECPPAHEILFISSIRAAQFFFARCNSSATIACAGLETANKVAEQFQKEVAFIAQQSDKPQLEALRFNEWRAGRSVCFPSSQLALGTYAELLPAQEKIILPVYETYFKEQHIAAKDIYVFSSPSNVNSFLKVNQIAPNAKVVAWGSSTAQALNTHQIEVHKVLNGDQQNDLLKWLSKIL